MSRLENHAMLRDAATDVFNLQYALLEKYGLAAIEGDFSWKTDFLGNFSYERQIHLSGSSSVFDRSVFSFALIFHRSASRHAVNNTHKQRVQT